jgi:histidyl-tRNA synthetase
VGDRQWNLDIVGIPGVEAEAEVLAAMVAFFKSAGLGPSDVGIKVGLFLQTLTLTRVHSYIYIYTVESR